MTVRICKGLALFASLLSGSVAFSQNSLSLQDALKAAIANNPALKAQRMNIDVAGADVVTARLRPNLNLSNQTINLTRKSDFAPNTDWINGLNRQTMWQLYKPIQWPGQRQGKIGLARQNQVLSQKQFEQTQRDLLLNVAAKWLHAWTSNKQLNLLSQAKNNLDSLVSINKYRLQKQVISETDLTRTQLLASQFEIQIRNATLEYNNSLRELAFLTGLGSPVTVDTVHGFTQHIPLVSDSLMSYALDTRPDVAVARAGIDVANSNARLQKALAYPTPDIGVLYNPQNKIPYWGIYAAVDLPFFSRNQGEIKKAKLLQDQSALQMNALQLQVATEVDNAYKSYAIQKQNTQKFIQLQQQAQTILDNVRYAYLHGGTTIVDFLEAQRSWLETQQQYYETLQQYSESYIQLLYVTGKMGQLTQTTE